MVSRLIKMVYNVIEITAHLWLGFPLPSRVIKTYKKEDLFVKYLSYNHEEHKFIYLETFWCDNISLTEFDVSIATMF